MPQNEAANFFPNVRTVSVKENEISDNESCFNGRELKRTKPWNSLQLFNIFSLLLHIGYYVEHQKL